MKKNCIKCGKVINTDKRGSNILCFQCFKKEEYNSDKFKIVLNKNRDGVSLWVNGKWVLDASLFKETMELDLDKSRMKIIPTTNKNFIRYKFKGSK